MHYLVPKVLPSYSIIIFKFKCEGAMIETEYSCAVVHSDRIQKERDANLKKFKGGEVRFLICTDAAARGLDIKELPYMISILPT
jgi:superfamily II DNA/RNA helicase